MLSKFLGVWNAKRGGDSVDLGIHHVWSGKREEHLGALFGYTSTVQVLGKIWGK